MIKDKNIFECIILENQIYFPNYVCYGPSSYGMQRRKMIFRNRFPEKGTSILDESSWRQMLKKYASKRKTFKYNEEDKSLKEERVFTNGYGYPICIGDKFMIDNEVHTVKDLKIVKHAGLIAENSSGKKFNVGFLKKNNEGIWEK